jgi:hypothetical protein
VTADPEICLVLSCLTLLFWTGQRIGDWNRDGGRHGILGITLADIDQGRRTITVLLKGARDAHRVPVNRRLLAVASSLFGADRNQ